jgi:hypothetical protein
MVDRQTDEMNTAASKRGFKRWDHGVHLPFGYL